MDPGRTRRFFVTITAADERMARELLNLDLDLFAGRVVEPGYAIDGLITLEDVGSLVEAGYQVLVGQTDRPERRPEFVGFEKWSEAMLADLEGRHDEEG